MRSSSRPPRAAHGRRPMERNRVAWTMLSRLGIAPTEPGWQRARLSGARRYKGRPHKDRPGR